MALGYYPTQKEAQYHAVDYSNPEVIQGLLRYLVDFKTQAHEDMNTELLCIYMDITKAFNNVDITPRQRLAVKLYIQGWSIDDIGQKMSVSHQAANKLISKVITKISNYLAS